MDVLVQIKRLVLRGDVRFTEKARDEMDADGLRVTDVLESVMNAQASPRRLSPPVQHADDPERSSMSSKASATKARSSTPKARSSARTVTRRSTSSSRPSSRRSANSRSTSSAKARPRPATTLRSCVVCGSKQITRKLVKVRRRGRPDFQVTAEVCANCGERFYDLAALAALER